MYFFPNCCLFFVYDSVSIGQNLLNEKPVENSLLVDFAYYHFNSFNGNLNGYQSPGRIICIGPCGPKTTKADDKLEALVQWLIQGRGPGGPAPPSSFLDQNEARKAEQKKFFLRPLPPRLSQGLDYRLPLIRRSVSAIIVPRFTVLKVELDKAVIYLFIYLLIVLCLFIILGLQAVSKKRGR